MSAPYTAFAHIFIIMAFLHNIFVPTGWALSLLLMTAAVAYAALSTKEYK